MYILKQYNNLTCITELELNQPNFRQAWDHFSPKLEEPSIVNDIHVLDYYDFEKQVRNADKNFAFDLVEKLLMGDAFVLKQALTESSCKDIIDWCFNNISQTETGFHKILDGVPNFHRIIDEETTKKYSTIQIRHSHYFFRWNKDTFNIWPKVTPFWEVAKLVGGYDKDEYISNVPSIGTTDRLQIIRYPSGGGGLKPHVDAKKNQKVIYGLMLSTRGESYQEGGFCADGQYGDKVDFEMYLSAGDILMHYPTVVHYVEEVDPKSKLQWDSKNGRWFVGFYSNDSDYLKDRATAKIL